MTESREWKNCPLMIRYESTKRAYIKELRLEDWRNKQRKKLWRVIRQTFAEIDEAKKEYWVNRLYSYYCKRFYWITGYEWVAFLGELNDKGAYGEYVHDKARKYCCLVRDTAYWMTHKKEPFALKVCEPVDYYEIIRMAA